ncbi:signal transduction histidine kinase [Streptomyces sp. V3I8]|uniref:sensor histidine kinase n=1 Tax=Streptomyces sp. V3I8 TaxID=3042279 RepID=UPI00278190BB|nr:histidine kinase [Streptomyces sp. V3I8]MDQ1034003.1 signal transduction histidine kinase [Streptomyces sp. V3I8]
MLGSAGSILKTNAPALAARWGTLDVLRRDAVVTVLLAPVVFAPVTAPLGAQFGDLAERPSGLPGALVTAALWLPLVMRRRLPAVCLALVAGAFAVHELVGYPQTCASMGLYVALYSVGAHSRRTDRTHRALGVAAATASYALFALGLHGRGSPQRVPDFAIICTVLVGCWAVGTVVRARQDGEAERRRLSVEAATARERARIARELHDVVTHHVTAMVIQADAAGFLLADAPERVEAGLGAISDSGRHALTDLQHLLGVLKASGSTSDDMASDGTTSGGTTSGGPWTGPSAADRTPGPGEVGDLVEQTRAAGQPVELTERGEGPPAASAVRLAAYRVVQETLTNALKHAPGHRTRVDVHYGRHEVEVEVTTEGPPVTAGVPRSGPLGRGGGHGLTGLRERVGVLGGELSAGKLPDGGFGVRARIPSGTGTGTAAAVAGRAEAAGTAGAAGGRE